jgi:acetyl esterase/lipase
MLLLLILINGHTTVKLTARETNSGEEVRLWEGKAPGARGNSSSDIPTLTIYLPDSQTITRTAVVIFPGGGYGHLAMDHEGHQVAQWLNSHGIAAFITKYRYNPYRHPIPLTDAQRAIRTIRAHAKKWNIDREKVGVLGFSAGGHLASSTITHFDMGNPFSADPIEIESCRPDFAVLVYPVISFTTEFVHEGSRRNLIGENPSSELQKHLSSDLQITASTPPTFLIHTSYDTVVPAENSILFYRGLRKFEIPAEMHIYEIGQHGFGLAQQDPVLSSWTDRCIDWLKVRGILNYN